MLDFGKFHANLHERVFLLYLEILYLWDYGIESTIMFHCERHLHPLILGNTVTTLTQNRVPSISI